MSREKKERKEKTREEKKRKGKDLKGKKKRQTKHLHIRNIPMNGYGQHMTHTAMGKCRDQGGKNGIHTLCRSTTVEQTPVQKSTLPFAAK